MGDFGVDVFELAFHESDNERRSSVLPTLLKMALYMMSPAVEFDIFTSVGNAYMKPPCWLSFLYLPGSFKPLVFMSFLTVGALQRSLYPLLYVFIVSGLFISFL